MKDIKIVEKKIKQIIKEDILVHYKKKELQEVSNSWDLQGDDDKLWSAGYIKGLEQALEIFKFMGK